MLCVISSKHLTQAQPFVEILTNCTHTSQVETFILERDFFVRAFILEQMSTPGASGHSYQCKYFATFAKKTLLAFLLLTPSSSCQNNSASHFDRVGVSQMPSQNRSGVSATSSSVCIWSYCAATPSGTQHLVSTTSVPFLLSRCFFLRVLIRCPFGHFRVQSSILCTSWRGR